MANPIFDRRSTLFALGGGVAAVAGTTRAEVPPIAKSQVDGLVRFEDFGALGDGRADDSAAIQLAMKSNRRVMPAFKTYSIAQEISLNHDNALDLSGCVLRQASRANLSRLVHVNISNRASSLQSSNILVVEGNRRENLGSVTGIEVSKLKKAYGRLVAAATDCTVGTRITDQVEYARISAHSENCDVGLHLLANSRKTPDELLLDVVGHSCGTFLLTEGTSKMTGTVFLACEQSEGWGVRLEDIGWWQIFGTIRGCGKAGGGGLRVDGPQLRGDLKVVGASSVTCEWGGEFISGRLEGLTLSVGGRFRNGVRIQGGVEGSLKLFLQNTPGVGVGLVLGGSDVPLEGFHIEDGSRIVGRKGAAALELGNCRNCYVGAGLLSGTCEISEVATGNTVVVPRRSATRDLLIRNRRAEMDNRILFRGSYTLNELESLNDGVPFRGMEAEMCTDFGLRRARHDGSGWLPA